MLRLVHHWKTAPTDNHFAIKNWIVVIILVIFIKFYYFSRLRLWIRWQTVPTWLIRLILHLVRVVVIVFIFASWRYSFFVKFNKTFAVVNSLLTNRLRIQFFSYLTNSRLVWWFKRNHSCLEMVQSAYMVAASFLIFLN